MIKQIKSNKIIRKIFYLALNNINTSRKFKNIKARIYFNAGKNFNLFFSKGADIEPEITEKITRYIKNDSVVFDIGANIGYYTIIASKIAFNGKIIAIEPDINNIPQFTLNCEKNNLNNVFVEKVALSSKEGWTDFFSDITTGRTSSLDNFAWHPNASIIEKKVVKTVTLDALSEKYGYPNIIKCDVEGYELEVLRGGVQTLKNKPIIFIEVNENNAAELFDLLTNNEYTLYNADSIYEEKEPLKIINVRNIYCLPKDIK